MDYDHVKKQLGYGIQTESKDNAIKAIEQLTARVRELEEFKANVVKECASIIKHAHKDIAKQLAASQLHAEQLREKIETLWDIIDDIDSYGDMAKADDKLFRSLVERRQKERWSTGITTDGYVLNIPIPHSTSALDAYVAEKVSAARNIDEKQIAYLFEERSALIRKRDLAVEAIRHCIAAMGSVTDVKKAMDWPQLHNAQMLSLQALDAIKESEAMAQGEKK